MYISSPSFSVATALGALLPPPAGIAAAAPALLGREGRPPAYTLYVDIPLGRENPARPMTGIFVGAGYRPQPQVDLILYLHGTKLKHPTTTIDQYWNRRRFPYWLLREAVNEARKNVLLVAPTLGPHAEAGRLVRPEGFDWYLNQVMSALQAYGPYKGASGPPPVGNVILACHSGGGFPMLLLALSRGSYTSHVREAWGFDSLYGHWGKEGVERAWARWARLRPEARFYVYYLGSTEARSKRLADERLPNVFVARSTAPGHNYVPITHLRERIRSTPFLPDT